MEVPTSWVQVLRGPRPLSQKWPTARPVQRPRQPQVNPVSAGPRAPTVRVSPDGNREAARLNVVKLQQALARHGGHRRSCVKAELKKAKKVCQRPTPRCRSRRVPEIHRQVREAVSSRLETEQTIPVEEAPVPADWKAQMEALQATGDYNWHVPSRVSGHSTNAKSGSCKVGQLDARSSGGAPKCDEGSAGNWPKVLRRWSV